ncbi:glucokinase [Amycolatopsis bartoniae]|uniref:Sugar kinase n=1 Tax=Amycolatopsis bartoniae TaxID=941986 RepID=A0A8H9IWW7_9PSEU|nr:ROK family protein [Amycolatopsis bartoniae]MBB2937735.1 glucokinase [Amycolatopsis bartoniae]TVT08183.1 ROK family protein [Amycolatopsis bartoniae]GHF40314.1 sugar kinase [Amycolatopsis bartoniae]
MPVLGIDVGGTSVKARVTGEDGAVLAQWREPTPHGDVAALAAMVRRFTERHPVDAVGLVVPGVVDERNGRCLLAVNLGWHDVPVRDVVAAELAVPLAFGQDVRAGALAEFRTGAAAGDGGTVLFVPVGTGLAGALVVRGEVLDSGGWAGELGQVLLAEGPHAGARVEEIASAAAVARRAGAPDALTVASLVRQGDPKARAVWEDCVRVLAESIAWTVAVAGCSTVVVGGGLAEAGPLLLDPLAREVAARTGVLRTPALVRAAHGDAAAVVGATLLAREVAA